SELIWDLLESGRQLRQDSQVKNRYRLPELYIFNSSNLKENELVKSWKTIFEKELNVEKVHFEQPKVESKYKTSNSNEWTFYLDTNVTNEWKFQWKRADVLRTVQFLRKKASLPLTYVSSVAFNSSDKNLLSDLFSKEFEEKLQTDAFVEIVSNPEDTWMRKKVKGMELEVFLKNS
ncbi:MAG: hypothetical protein ACW99Q_27770, partial [Candidatus Kariarchaeaceae archaeon]